jgi:hypothetical protein
MNERLKHQLIIKKQINDKTELKIPIILFSIAYIFLGKKGKNEEEFIIGIPNALVRIIELIVFIINKKNVIKIIILIITLFLYELIF